MHPKVHVQTSPKDQHIVQILQHHTAVLLEAKLNIKAGNSHTDTDTADERI